MGFNKAAGDQLTAAELNSFYPAAGLYAASSTGNDSYAITVTPAPNDYDVGDTYTFKADVANTGAATLNVNGLGAKSIVKLYNNALVTGDILAGQIVRVSYDGTNFQMLSQVSTLLDYQSGVTTRDMTAASGAQTIAHGLGVTPRRIRVKALSGTSSTTAAVNISAQGTYNGTNTKAIYMTTQVGTAVNSDVSTTNILTLIVSAGNNQVAVATFDATNITLTWTKTGTPTGTAQILWEAWA